jgi:hypothetical protein
MKTNSIKKQKQQQINREYSTEEIKAIHHFKKITEKRHLKIDHLLITSFITLKNNHNETEAIQQKSPETSDD